MTKLHATMLKTQIGHRTFIRVHAILVFFALIDATVTKFIWCVNFKVLVVVTKSNRIDHIFMIQEIFLLLSPRIIVYF